MQELKEKHIQFLKFSLTELQTQVDPTIVAFIKIYNEILVDQKDLVRKSRQKILNLGGLHVIGTERHTSRRIDNQLRGRAGRQGDPGSSRFFLSLEDELIRIFGGDRILNLMKNLEFPENRPLKSGLLNKTLKSSQKKVETFYFETRKQLFEYDQVVNVQRNSFYAKRKSILKQKSYPRKLAQKILEHLIMFDKQVDSNKVKDPISFNSFQFQNLVGSKVSEDQLVSLFEKCFGNNSEIQFYQGVLQHIEIKYDFKAFELEMDGLMIKAYILDSMDDLWADHLKTMKYVQDSVRWRSYGQKDPLTEYKKETYLYFNQMLAQNRYHNIYTFISMLLGFTI
jgi:preprotein translocase subunit SecA